MNDWFYLTVTRYQTSSLQRISHAFCTKTCFGYCCKFFSITIFSTCQSSEQTRRRSTPWSSLQYSQSFLWPRKWFQRAQNLMHLRKSQLSISWVKWRQIASGSPTRGSLLIEACEPALTLAILTSSILLAFPWLQAFIKTSNSSSVTQHWRSWLTTWIPGSVTPQNPNSMNWNSAK